MNFGQFGGTRTNQSIHAAVVTDGKWKSCEKSTNDDDDDNDDDDIDE